jgi:membrane protein
MKLIFKRIFECLYNPIVNLINHDGVEHAGYMSFLTMLSLFPFLVFILSFASFIGESSYGINFIQMLMDVFPNEIISSIKPRIEQIQSGPPESLLTISIVGTIWTASSSVEGLRTILNRVYNITTPPSYIFRRLLSIAQFLLLNILIIFIMIILVLVPILENKIVELLNLIPNMQSISNEIDLIFSDMKSSFRRFLIILSLLFTISGLYMIIPNKKISYFSVIPGAFLVSIGWVIVGYIYSNFIIEYQQLNIVYGSLASIIISMIFFFIIHVVFIFGAEFNYYIQKKR